MHSIRLLKIVEPFSRKSEAGYSDIKVRRTSNRMTTRKGREIGNRSSQDGDNDQKNIPRHA
ncbi:MAG TPA: hypothetical protein VK909_17755 [Anaerolineales bacterium]|nr:hypothetical protein [Anaerolineales bacterium]